jgi:hypothetical protein
MREGISIEVSGADRARLAAVVTPEERNPRRAPRGTGKRR